MGITPFNSSCPQQPQQAGTNPLNFLYNQFMQGGSSIVLQSWGGAALQRAVKRLS
jgi:hypothetical protein